MAAPTLDPLTQQALAGLQEIPLPAAVSYAPQTIGWVGVAVVLVAAVVWWASRRRRRWVANRYRREALAELATLEARMAVPAERRAAVAAVPALLKRTALACEPRVDVAALSAAAWLAFLDRTFPPGGFVTGAGRWLPMLAYGYEGRVADDDVRAVVALARRWIGEHDARL